ncbi:protein NRT1/ PTR FAMILY 2.7-like isoform X1 [Dioscorea cayenensis subsp. rotundata]|uniref:Protein NRT1/ PTR FAMILY 2.7-like isoform X1 n=1 Tax=Dioscorea cayennensis subsp. rotundata TaxID=55577 RepID=A0AB40BLC2_DIOCR|nr:protein NRT1/ PTR FAMILY 2.7-like isoform X1 [Dioscorea cayenensis subsp. rotundata]
MAGEEQDVQTQPHAAHDHESRTPAKQGGWITIPFILGNAFGLALVLSGVMGNFTVYLIKCYNFKRMDAALLTNIMYGTSSFLPLLGAILSDSFFGCFLIVAFSTVASLCCIIILTITAGIKALRPPNTYTQATSGQLAVLYTGIVLYTIGAGGTRFSMMKLGADQLSNVGDQDVFFNWSFIVLYGAVAIGSTVIVYVEDSISWELGFGICLTVTALAVLSFLLGIKYYLISRPKRNPFMTMARVVVAGVRKRKLALPEEEAAYYRGLFEKTDQPLFSSFSCMNRATLIQQGDVATDGSISRPWSLCSVEDVNDLKTLIRIVPLWTSNVFLSISIATQTSLSVLQALTMDRSLGSHFSVPASSFSIATLLAICLTLFILDRGIYPLCHRLTSYTPTPLQRVGVGQAFNIAAMVASALIEHRRSIIVHEHQAENQPDWIVPMSAFWLVLPYVFIGIGEAFHFPGQIAFYYQEFPKSLKSTAIGIVAVLMSIGFYLSMAVLAVVRRATSWLPDNLNSSRLENVYWMLTLVASINFFYFILCAKFYKKQSDDKHVVGAVN